MLAAETSFRVGDRALYVGPEWYRLADPQPVEVFGVRDGLLLVAYDDRPHAAFVAPEELAVRA